MKFSLSNLLAIFSILIWATAWAATEKKAASPDPIHYLSAASDIQSPTMKLKSAKK